MTRIRRTERVNAYGETEITEDRTAIAAVVVPEAGASLMREADMSDTTRTVRVYTQADVQTQGPGRQPDILHIADGVYLVTEAKAYMGFGFTEAVAEQMTGTDHEGP